jgi:hypothetical protein
MPALKAEAKTDLTTQELQLHESMWRGVKVEVKVDIDDNDVKTLEEDRETKTMHGATVSQGKIQIRSKTHPASLSDEHKPATLGLKVNIKSEFGQVHHQLRECLCSEIKQEMEKKACEGDQGPLSIPQLQAKQESSLRTGVEVGRLKAEKTEVDDMNILHAACSVVKIELKNRDAEDGLDHHVLPAPGSEKKHVCNVCKKSFKYALTLKRHMLIHTGEKKHF